MVHGFPSETANGVVCPATPPSGPPLPGAANPNLGMTISVLQLRRSGYRHDRPSGQHDHVLVHSGVSGRSQRISRIARWIRSTTKRASPAPPMAPPMWLARRPRPIDAKGDVLTSTDADGDTTSYTYGRPANPGLPTVTTDPDGKVTTDTYNAEGEILTQMVTDTQAPTRPPPSTPTTRPAASTARSTPRVLQLGSVSVFAASDLAADWSDPTRGYTDTIYDADGQVISDHQPHRRDHPVRLRRLRQQYCTVTPPTTPSVTRCPTPPPTTPPTSAATPTWAPPSPPSTPPASHPDHQPARRHHPHHLRPGRQRHPDHRRVQQRHRRPQRGHRQHLRRR